jgi:hypothetical protein
MPKATRAETLAEETITSADVGTLSDVGLAVSKPDEPSAIEPASAVVAPTHFSPEVHARATGNAVEKKSGLRFGGGRPDKDLTYSWQHAAAAQLHGWAAHEHHTGAAIALTRVDYEAALKAAAEPVTRYATEDGQLGALLDQQAVARLNGTKPTTSRYEPHPAALSPHAPKEG